jgi:phosphohistidine phosphatase SixA
MSGAADSDQGRAVLQDVARRLKEMAVVADERRALASGRIRTAATREAVYAAGYDAAYASGFRDACQQAAAGLFDGLANAGPTEPDTTTETEG